MPATRQLHDLRHAAEINARALVSICAVGHTADALRRVRVFFNLSLNTIFGRGGKRRPDTTAKFPGGSCPDKMCEVRSNGQNASDLRKKMADMRRGVGGNGSGDDVI